MRLQDTEALAINLMKRHDLIAPAFGERVERHVYRHPVRDHIGRWTFRFDDAKVRFGSCRYRGRVITVSRHLAELNDEEKVRDVILHEIAHALVGQGHGHDRTWRRMAKDIGCDGLRCYGDDVRVPEGRWVGECPLGHVLHRHKRPKAGRRQSCGQCSPRFEERFLITWKRNVALDT